MNPNKLVEYWGSVKEAAKALNVTPGAVYQWIDAGRIPPLRQFQAQWLMEGKGKSRGLK